MSERKTAARVSVTPAPSPLLARKCACGESGGKCKSCEDEAKKPKGMLQRKASRDAALDRIPAIVGRVLDGPGQPLDELTRDFMESRFGHDFGGVRVHVGAEAAASASAVGAHAYTVGNHVVFAAGKYEPHSDSGRQLLAHELTHTLQQRSIASAPQSMRVSHASESSEREADAIATRLMTGNVTAEPHAQRGPQRLARTDAPAPDPNPNKKQVLKDVHGIEELAGVPDEVVDGKKLKWFNVTQKFPIPAEKGPEGARVFGLIESEKSGMVMAADTAGNRKRAIKAARKLDLRAAWAGKLNWPLKDTATLTRLWTESGGVGDPITSPKNKDGDTCQFDHIRELQMGGPDSADNLALVGGTNNLASAKQISAEIARRVLAVVEAYDEPGQAKINQVGLRYTSIALAGEAKCDACCVIDAEARKRVQPKPALPADMEEYTLKWSAFSENAIVPKSPEKGKGSPIEGTAARIVPGFVLQTLFREKPQHTIDAIVEPDAAMPITFKKGETVPFTVSADHKVSVGKYKKFLEFDVTGASPGKITKLSIDERGMHAEGTIEPTIPILKDLPLKFVLTPDTLSASIGASKDFSPIKGVHLKNPKLNFQFFPDFKPEGTALLVVGSNFLKGNLSIGFEGKDLTAKADVDAKVPGLNSTKGTIAYRKGAGWSGEFNFTTGKPPLIPSAAVKLSMTDDGIDASGAIDIQPPGAKNPIKIGIERTKGGNLLYKGSGIIDLPRLKPITIDLEYSNEGLSAKGTAPFVLFDQPGEVTLGYDKGAFYGIVETFTFKKGRASVTLKKLKLAKGKFSGTGEITMPLGSRFVAKGTVGLDEQEQLSVTAALQIAEPIKLFEPIKGDYKLLDVGIDIPIPGASIGNLGLQAQIRGAITAGYSIGPLTLESARIAAGVDPLKEGGPQVELEGKIVLPANLYIKGSVSGGVALSIVVAEIAGGLTVTASINLPAAASLKGKVLYTPERIVVDGELAAAVKLLIGVAFDAWVRARAGLGWFSVTTEKVWNLGSLKFDPGIGFNMTATLHYESDKVLQPPKFTFNDPKVDPEALISGSFGKAEGTAKEKEVD
jgi:hypothetical protein